MNQKTDTAAKRRPLAKTARSLGNLLFVLLAILVSVLLICLVQSRRSGESPTLLGYRLLVVMSGSMSPAIETGSLLAVKAVEPSQLKIGDVISYAGPEGNVTHRIVGIETEAGLRFITMGDANDVADPAVLPEQVIGVVALVLPWLGRALLFSQTRRGLLLLIIIPALLILLWEGRSLWRYAAEEDRRRAKEKTDKQPEADKHFWSVGEC